MCLIGGFDQFHFFKNCTPEETRREVRRCFQAAGDGGGFILSLRTIFLMQIPSSSKPMLRKPEHVCIREVFDYS